MTRNESCLGIKTRTDIQVKVQVIDLNLRNLVFLHEPMESSAQNRIVSEDRKTIRGRDVYK